MEFRVCSQKRIFCFIFVLVITSGKELHTSLTLGRKPGTGALFGINSVQVSYLRNIEPQVIERHCYAHVLRRIEKAFAAGKNA